MLLWIFNCSTYSLSPQNYNVVATAWKLQVVFEFPNAKVLNEPLEPGLLPSLNCFALWAGQIIFRVKTVDWERLFLQGNRGGRRNRWSRKERDRFLAEVEEQFQIVHEQLAVLCQDPISKPKLKREQMKEGRTRRQKRFSPGWDWWRWWRASATLTLTPRNLRRYVGGGGLAMLEYSPTWLGPCERSNRKILKDATETAATGLPIEQDSEEQERAGPWIAMR